jgi:hypothetical protein
MTPADMIAAAEARARDAEKNLASCVATLNEHRSRTGGVPNPEVIALAHVQAVLSQTYAHLAVAKATVDGSADA